MTNTKFTEGPWEMHDNGSFYDIGPPTGTAIIPVHPTVMIGVDYRNKANGERIVKCVNYHDRLVEALLQFSNSRTARTYMFDDCERVEALLAELDIE
jgi:hypothetical protein